MRTIKEETAAQKSIDRAISKFPRLDDVFQAVLWRISRKPDTGEHVSDEFYIIASTSVIVADGAPRIVVLYSFNDDEVTIYEVKVES